MTSQGSDHTVTETRFGLTESSSSKSESSDVLCKEGFCVRKDCVNSKCVTKKCDLENKNCQIIEGDNDKVTAVM